MTRPRTIKLGASVKGLGYCPSSWRFPGLPTTADFAFYREMTEIAEKALFDLVFIPDRLTTLMSSTPHGALGREVTDTDLEPLTILSALAALTRRVGLAATVSTTFTEPYNIARSFASLDHISGGRAAWNVVTSTLDKEARNFGLERMPSKAERYARANEAVDVVMRLWGSWEADAFIRDKDTGQYYDPGKVSRLDHQGPFFRVDGPLNVPRPPQGRPVIVQAGASALGLDLAARTAEVVYTVQNQLGEAVASRTALRAGAASHGRDPDGLLVMPGLLTVLGETEEAARIRYREMGESIDPAVGLAHLALMLGDLSAHDLDGPVPDLADHSLVPSRRKVWLELARRENLSIRRLYQTAAIANGHLTAIGTPEQVADKMEEWFSAGAADGFNIMSALAPVSLREFTEHVLPILRRRGLVRTAYEGSTLREHLGLPFA